MAAAVQPSATLAAGAKARQLKAEGIHVFDFSLGEPDFTTPEHICQAAVKAMQAGHTHYTPATGIAELRAAVAAALSEDLRPAATPPSRSSSPTAPSTRCTTPWPPPSAPATRSSFPTPYWVSYSDLVQMTGAPLRPGADHARERLQDDAGAAARRHHAAQQAADAQLAVQSDRHRLHAPGAGSAGRRGPRLAAGRPQRRDLRAAGLRRRPGDLLRHAAAGAGRADHHRQRREQDLRHDRLAIGWAVGPGCMSSRRWATCRASRPAARAASASTPPWRPWKATRSASRRCAASSRPGATWSAGGWRPCRASSVRCRAARFMPSSTCPATSAGRWPARKVTDSVDFLPGGPGVGPRQPGAGLRLRCRGLRPPVVRHQPRAAQRRAGPAGAAC